MSKARETGLPVGELDSIDTKVGRRICSEAELEDTTYLAVELRKRCIIKYHEC